jgi:hypothetical protein
MHKLSIRDQAFSLAAAIIPASAWNLLKDLLELKALLPLLAKPRNGQRWTPEELGQLRAHLWRLFVVGPCLIVLLFPGSSLLLPALLWWLRGR